MDTPSNEAFVYDTPPLLSPSPNFGKEKPKTDHPRGMEWRTKDS